MKINEFLYELDSIKAQVDNLLEERRKNIAGIGTINELEYISNELIILESQLKLGNIPPKTDRQLISAHIVMESWPLDYELTEHITQLNFMFRYELEEK
jgi:hypothetical protein